MGWREWFAVPGLGIEKIKAKLDTGARTSALHAIRLRPYQADGVDRIRFLVHPIQRDFHTTVTCDAVLSDRRVIRSSSGTPEERYVIETTLALADMVWPIELTLTNRDQMGFRMLIGRTAMRRRLIIEPGRSYLAEKTITVPRPARRRRTTKTKRAKTKG